MKKMEVGIGARPSSAFPVRAKVRISSLVDAVRKNDYDLVVHYLARRHPECIDEQDEENGMTGLHVAARDGNVPLVRLLLTHRANARLTDRQGDSALHYAAYRGQTPVIRLLVNHGAEINGVNNKGFTPVFLSAWKGWTDATRLLLDVGAKVDGKRIAKSTPLLAACKAGHYDIAVLLLERDAWVEGTSTEDDVAPLHLAAQAGHRDLVELLLEHGATVDARNKKGQTPLHLACMKDRSRTACMLIQNGASLQSKDESGATPLQVAVKCGHHALVKTVRKTIREQDNTQVNDMDNFQYSEKSVVSFVEPVEKPKPKANMNGNKSVISYSSFESGRRAKTDDGREVQDIERKLVQRILKISPPESSLQNVKSPKEIGSMSSNDDSPPANSVLSDESSSFSNKSPQNALMKKMSDAFSRLGQSLLRAVMDGDSNKVDRLLRAGARTEQTDSKGETPLSWACFYGFYSIARLLLRNGADANKQDKAGNSCLHHASYGGHANIVILLLENDADPNVMNVFVLESCAILYYFSAARAANSLNEKLVPLRPLQVIRTQMTRT